MRKIPIHKSRAGFHWENPVFNMMIATLALYKIRYGGKKVKSLLVALKKGLREFVG